MKEEAQGMTRKEFLKVSVLGAGAVVGAGVLIGTEKVMAGTKGHRLALVIDLDRRMGCKACAIACKTEFDTKLGVFRSQVIYNQHGEYPETRKDFLPWLCNHCENPPCVRECPVAPIEDEFKGVKFQKKASYQRPDGAVLVDQNRCIGCGACIQNCPYRATRFFDPGKRAGGASDEHPASKCSFCEHRLEAGVVPSCVNTCPARARIFGDLNDSTSEVSKLLKQHQASVLLPAQGTNPAVFYIGKNRLRINEALNQGEDLRTDAATPHGGGGCPIDS